VEFASVNSLDRQVEFGCQLYWIHLRTSWRTLWSGAPSRMLETQAGALSDSILEQMESPEILLYWRNFGEDRED
jgi:hypothetical protein